MTIRALSVVVKYEAEAKFTDFDFVQDFTSNLILHLFDESNLNMYTAQQ